MLSPLKPLLCRHDFYWSERHGCDRCRRCGKRQAAEAIEVLPVGRAGVALAAAPVLAPTESRIALEARAPRERRERLLGLLDWLAQADHPSREQAIDVVLAVIEDAQSADPVLFGQEAADRFARLSRARSRAAA